MNDRLVSVINAECLHELRREAEAAPAGNFVEVGVYRGGSAQHLYEVACATGRQLYLYDTFAGMPFRDAIDVHPVGDFGDTSLTYLRKVLPLAIICVGTFPQTLGYTGPIALAHVDCDQYRSVRDACVTLAPRMVAGGVMVFDDYNELPGARLAVDEVFGDRVEISPATGKARVRF
jgi:hypothetical protein